MATSDLESWVLPAYLRHELELNLNSSSPLIRSEIQSASQSKRQVASSQAAVQGPQHAGQERRALLTQSFRSRSQ